MVINPHDYKFNEDTYVQSYVQAQNTGIAYETLLTLQLLEHGENGGQRTTNITC